MAMAAYKPGRTRNKSKNLPRQKYVIDLSEEEKICSNCGTKMVKVREIVSERIVHVLSTALKIPTTGRESVSVARTCATGH